MDMTASEEYVKQGMQKAGWNTLKRGYPDFLCYKEENGKMILCFVEVKTFDSKLTQDQLKMKSILEKYGLEVKVIRVDLNQLKNIKFYCELCGCNLPPGKHTGRNRKYCNDCGSKIKKEQNKELSKIQRSRHGHSFNEKNINYHDESKHLNDKILHITWDIDDECAICKIKIEEKNIEYDKIHGEVICRKCGLIVGKEITT